MGVEDSVLREVERRVLWLAVRMVDHANRERPPDEIKVGGHQASSASMVSIMTALWFGHLEADDRVSVKPHASPVLHSINYLLGQLDASYLTRLRSFGGLQAYPSRTKDPDPVDFSTGSVGLGVVAPLFAAAADRYAVANRPARRRVPRFIALAGDAELDEGNVWEAIAEPALRGLGNVMWIIDTNRQSLDRVVPDQKIKKLQRFFDAAGWDVKEVKYGSRLQAAFARQGGDALRRHIDEMSNERYQSLFGLDGGPLRDRFLDGADATVRRFAADLDDNSLRDLALDLGGHDLSALIDVFDGCDHTDQPSVVFAYTVKGWGLPIAGDPHNHAALLNAAHIEELRSQLGLDATSEWDRFEPESPAGILCDEVARRLRRDPPPAAPAIAVPIESLPAVSRKPTSTQEAFGRVLVRLADDDRLRPHLVTTSPDVSVSTNLGGWINKVGVFSPDEQPNFLGEDRLLHWRESPQGQHIELGISEMNLFLLLQALSLGHEIHGQRLLAVGTVYDPFICRGLDALVHALYNGARFVIAGTPSGVSLAPEGGAHQSSVTPSIGLELPELTYAEPCYARALDWLLCSGLAGLAAPEGEAIYLRLSTRPVDQGPFESLLERRDPNDLRADVVAGGYRLREPGTDAAVVLAGCGPVLPEVLRAADLLEAEGVPAVVLDLTSPDRLYRAWRSGLRDATRSARRAPGAGHLERLIEPAERHLPIVTVQDAASHALAWLGSVFGSRTVPVGVDRFGQSGRVADLYGQFDLLPEQIANAALVAAFDTDHYTT